jgi:hypothetical protein
MWIYFVKFKYEVFECLKYFKKRAKNQSGKGIEILLKDNGGEYVNKYVKQTFSKYILQLQ